jgi:hypothetical protein
MKPAQLTIALGLAALPSLLLLVAVLGQAGGIALARSGDGYNLSWWTADGGGATLSEDGRYTLDGTTGQPDAGVLEGDGYTLVGGFWGGVAIEYQVYLPAALRGL